MSTKKRLLYISGLKGIACCFIMFGHFFGIIKHISVSSFDLSAFSFMLTGPLSVLLDESFWLHLFFLSSGFLLALSKIDTIPVLITKCLRRFLRLGLPILFSSIIVYVIYLLVGMHNNQTESLFINTWYQSAYSLPVSPVDALLSPFYVLLLGRCPLNSVYWVLRDMFFASILIYVCLYIQSILSRRKWAVYVVSYGCVLFSYFISNTVFVCVIGMVLAQHRHHIERLLSKAVLCGIVGLIVCAAVATLYPGVYTSVLFFGVLIWTTPLFPRLEGFISSKSLLMLEKISFGIYSFHWPVICSVGAMLLLATWDLGVAWAFLLCFSMSIAATLILAILFSKTAERISGVITEKLTGTITRILTPRQKVH